MLGWKGEVDRHPEIARSNVRDSRTRKSHYSGTIRQNMTVAVKPVTIRARLRVMSGTQSPLLTLSKRPSHFFTPLKAFPTTQRRLPAPAEQDSANLRSGLGTLPCKVISCSN